LLKKRPGSPLPGLLNVTYRPSIYPDRPSLPFVLLDHPTG
jgi:hypothetical protein